MDHRLAHRVGPSSQATPAAVDKSPRRLKHKNPDAPRLAGSRDLRVDPASGQLARPALARLPPQGPQRELAAHEANRLQRVIKARVVHLQRQRNRTSVGRQQ